MRTLSGVRNVAVILLLCAFVQACGGARPVREGQTPAATRAVPPRVGLALGGGGARGFAEVGVLRVLEQEKIPVDLIVGTSVGSLIGAIYADSGSVLDAEFIAISITEEDIFDYKIFSFFSGGFVKGERLESFLDTRLRSKIIEDMKVPFAAVAVDLRTGRSVLFDKGPVSRAVHASCAIPGVFVPVTIDDRVFVDGGVTDPIPVDFARKKGAEVVIAVSISPEIPATAPENPISVVYHAVTIMSSRIGERGAEKADVVIHPDVGNIAYDDFSQKKRLIEAGEKAAREALPDIMTAICAKTRQVPVAAETSGQTAPPRE